jgi:Kef-type K+ transport system membrane component KefB
MINTILLANAGGGDPVPQVALGLGVILLISGLGKELMKRGGQAAVLGLLLGGIFLGNLKLLGINSLNFISTDSFVSILASLGTIFIMFEAGLESSVGKMREVGLRATAVALAGAGASIALGFIAARYLLPDAHPYAHWFTGVMIAATSVGVAAAVLGEEKMGSSEIGTLILGAAIIDDVIGLIALAVISGMIKGVEVGEALSYGAIALTLFKAVAFLAIAALFGRWLSHHSFRLASKLQSDGVLLTIALVFCFVFSALADQFGLAPMIGAFAAGLVLEDVHYRDLADREGDLDHLVKPIGMFLIPIFFVVVGTRVDLTVLLDLGAMKMAGVLLAAALLGKMACGVGVVGTAMNWRTVAAGMLPRGEVVIVIAAQGAKELLIGGKPVVCTELLSATVIMVVATTVIAPPLLKHFLSRGKSSTL